MTGPVRIAVIVVALAAGHYLLRLGLALDASAPDLLTVAVLVAARELTMARAALLGFVLGVLEDAYNVLAFGANAFALTVVAVAGAGSRDLFVGDSPVFAVSYLFLGKWVKDLLFWVRVGEDLREPFVRAVVIDGVVGAAYVALLGSAALWLTGAWSRSGP